MDITTIDGGTGSGSGTIVRDVSGLAVLTGRAVRLVNIRSRRDKPGLRPQHLKALQACAVLSSGQLKGAHAGIKEVVFIPGNTLPGGEYHFDVGTAGSAVMLAMALIPLGMYAKKTVSLVLRGGLFQDFAPTALYLEHVLARALFSMGINIQVNIDRPGYVPRGEGCIMCTVHPVDQAPGPFEAVHPGRPEMIRGVALCSHLKGRKVAMRMKEACARRLLKQGLSSSIEEVYDEQEAPAYKDPAAQAGACLAIWSSLGRGCLLGADMAGAPGRSSEEIGKKTAGRFLDDLSKNAGVDRYLADQLVPFAGLAQGESSYRVPEITDHLETRLWLIREFLGAQTAIEDRVVRIRGVGIKERITI